MIQTLNRNILLHSVDYNLQINAMKFSFFKSYTRLLFQNINTRLLWNYVNYMTKAHIPNHFYAWHVSFQVHKEVTGAFRSTQGPNVTIWGFSTLREGTLTALWRYLPTRTPTKFCLHWGMKKEPLTSQPSPPQTGLSAPQIALI